METNCKTCGTQLGINCGEAEQDFDKNYCSEGCFLESKILILPAKHNKFYIAFGGHGKWLSYVHDKKTHKIIGYKDADIPNTHFIF